MSLVEDLQGRSRSGSRPQGSLSEGPLPPGPVSSHPPVTFSLKDLFYLPWATRFNLGGVEHVAAQQLAEVCDLLSLFHFSASSAPNLLGNTLVKFFACIYYSQVSCKCYRDYSWFANQVAVLRLDFSSRDSCKAGFNLSHRLQPWLYEKGQCFWDQGCGQI